MKATGRIARAYLREWWPEAILVSLCGLIWATQNPQNAAAVLIAVGIGWAMGIRHRVLPLHRKVDRMTEGVGEMLDEMRAARGEEQPPAPPSLKLVKR